MAQELPLALIPGEPPWLPPDGLADELVPLAEAEAEADPDHPQEPPAPLAVVEVEAEADADPDHPQEPPAPLAVVEVEAEAEAEAGHPHSPAALLVVVVALGEAEVVLVVVQSAHVAFEDVLLLEVVVAAAGVDEVQSAQVALVVEVAAGSAGVGDPRIY
jgi:hypothetical protein